ncbi:hypothetical protein FKW50_14815 [Acetobacter pomorum]|uniref:hypothetical protein n=1 Tax=Acetobacter pomorum TaxID=65959 RepID=UPI0012850478|nr:hypothetical protein [Acetobacter pomorum]KAA8420761.1 hypothetical protein FKW54_13800 [Acetobacter pomorum]KAA8430808.1 hypothetical protein FKW50_14815 [Acetobacter pomorum]KAA8449115.1 hypothetical protein FKW52_12550 [Acetobacter pomorum]
MCEAEDEDDPGIRAFRNLQDTIKKSEQAYSRAATQLPDLAKQLEALDAKSTKSAQRVEEAAQEVTKHIKTDRLFLFAACGFGAISLVFCSAFLGDIKGSRAGYAEGFADGQRSAKERDALGEWAASSPSGRLAYQMDKVGQIQAFGMCKIEGYKVKTDRKGTWCVSESGEGLVWPIVPPTTP